MKANQEDQAVGQAFQNTGEGEQPDAMEEMDARTPGTEAAEAVCELAEALRQRDEYLDMSQRLQAEFENFRRRNNAIRAEAWEDGARETIAMMLPVMDNLERALESAKERNPLRDGVEMVYRQMLDLLEKRGVTVIDRVGEAFDPELENAVMQVGAENGEPGTVFAVMQKGYKTPQRVIRYAMVSVVASG